MLLQLHVTTCYEYFVYYGVYDYLEEQIKKLQSEIEEQHTAPADHEKEKLRASVKQLKMSIESKDRYACWVCNRAHERHEESDRSENEAG